jgi:pimeloyl-ACP methyl ester carboxylesterase
MTATSAPSLRRRRRGAGLLAALALGATLTACGSGGGTAAPSTTSTTSTTPPTPPTVERPSQTIDQLVTIGAGRLHVRCVGRGDATVLLLAGWDNGSETWTAVEPALSARARVCSYDRFGTGTSDAPAGPQTFRTQVADLHELLDRIDEPGPYVVVGHSFGGAEAVTFASMHPDEVAGVVLVDASPSTWPRTVCSVTAYAGGCELMRDPSRGERLDVFPAFAELLSITSLGDVPVTVLTAVHRSSQGISPDELARLDALWRRGTERWAALSNVSKIVVVHDTGHEIQVDQPGAVIAAVEDLLP